MTKREEGYYWVRWPKDTETEFEVVAFWNGFRWMLPGLGIEISDARIETISEMLVRETK